MKSLHYLGYEVPNRLSQETLQLAKLYLNTSKIKDRIATCNFELDEPGGRTLPRQYAENARKIAENAPLCILPQERLVGSATYLQGVQHAMPGGRFRGHSHTTANFAKAVTIGLSGLEAEIRQSLAAPQHTEEEYDFLDACLEVVDAMRIWHRRLVDALPDASNYAQPILKVLKQVPEYPATNFYEALQAFWFHFEFQRLCGNWSGLGRIDQLLAPYLKEDLAQGRITLDEARELIAHFWIKGTEWKGIQQGSGDAQHYQNIILLGVDDSGKQDIDPAVAELILDVVEELHISDYPIAVRINKRTPDSILRKIASVQRHGGGIVSIYNEDIVLQALQNFGYGEQAFAFTNDGCWETIIGGKTAFGYIPFDALQIFQHALFGEDETLRNQPSSWPQFASTQQLFDAWKDLMAKHAEGLAKTQDNAFSDPSDPALVLSIIVDDCIKRGKSYANRGARYSVRAAHAGGLPDVANSFHAINVFVFNDRLVTLDQLRQCMLDNWEGNEQLRVQVASSIEYYGNDNDQADQFARQVFDAYVQIYSKQTSTPSGVLTPVGISTFGRELAFAPKRLATAFGAKREILLAPNLSPTPGTEKHGPTAVINSFCKHDFTKLSNGTPLDMKLHPSAIQGEAGLDSLVAFMKTFVEQGGAYLQIDVADSRILRDAQLHPERYPNLSVRISGWSARFTTLDKKWQEMIIARTELAVH